MLMYFMIPYQDITIAVTTLPRKVIIGKWLAHDGRYKCPKLPIFTWKLKFYPWQQILSVVIFEVTGSFCLFSRKYLPNTQVWITIVYLPYFQEKLVLHKKTLWLLQPVTSAYYVRVSFSLLVYLTLKCLKREPSGLASHCAVWNWCGAEHGSQCMKAQVLAAYVEEICSLANRTLFRRSTSVNEQCIFFICRCR